MILRKFLWARESRIRHVGRPTNNVFVQVEAFDKDGSLARLTDEYPFVAKKDWDFLEELNPESDVGALGETIRWPVKLS